MAYIAVYCARREYSFFECPVDLQTRASRHGRLWKVRLYRTFRWARGHHRMVPPEAMER